MNGDTVSAKKEALTILEFKCTKWLTKGNQSYETKFKALNNIFKKVKILLYFSLIHSWSNWFKIKQNSAI